MTYGEQLAQRKQEAADAEAYLVAHFGPEAENCANWDDLWQQNWMRILTNSSISKLPNSLPSFGGWVSEDGRRAFAEPPNLYSDKFLFHFAKQLVGDETTVAAKVSEWLADADEMDCDQLNTTLGKVATWLANDNLHHVSGRGQSVDMGPMDSARLEAFFQSWNSTKDEAGLFIARPGIAIANRRPVPEVVVSSILHAVRRQIGARRQQLQAGVFIHTPKEQEGKMPLPTLALILIYEGKTVQRGEQANQLARNAGHTSGESLYQDYSYYSSYHNRIGFDNETAMKGRNMVKRIQTTLLHLSEAAKQKAENEIAIIKANIS